MNIAVGNDHAGFPLKKRVVRILEEAGETAVDCGTHDSEPADYPDVAWNVVRALADGQAERGIVICGSGIGAAIAANKVPGIRAGLCHDTYSARQGVEHDDMNVLCLGSRVIGEELAAEIVRAFLAARFSGEERHRLRLDKLARMEQGRTPQPPS